MWGWVAMQDFQSMSCPPVTSRFPPPPSVHLPLTGRLVRYDNHDGRGELAYCETDYRALFLPKCRYSPAASPSCSGLVLTPVLWHTGPDRSCGDTIEGDGVSAGGHYWHREHFSCT